MVQCAYDSRCQVHLLDKEAKFFEVAGTNVAIFQQRQSCTFSTEETKKAQHFIFPKLSENWRFPVSNFYL